jgi:hypothetical protein
MKHIINIFVVFIFFSVLPFSSFAEDTRGVERMGEGTKDVVTSPGQITEGISKETEEKGATGVVTGTAKGSVDSAGQAAEGAVDIGTGTVESVLDPITDY